MTHHTAEWTLRRFSAPDEVRESTHVGPGLGIDSCPVEHVGLVVSGCVEVRMDSGAELSGR